MDAVDCALVEIKDHRPRLLHAINHAYPTALRKAILAHLQAPEEAPFGAIIHFDLALADLFAQACEALLNSAGIHSDHIKAIGCHGQTICHRPNIKPPYTVQLGDCSRLAVLTGLPVIGDFRSGDMAAGGQGAPLAPLLHKSLFARRGQQVLAINIGGIANITLLPGNGHEAVTGYDTGPGNCLMDSWCQRHQGHNYDINGEWAARGKIHTNLLKSLLSDAYLRLAPPKSTGREVFNLEWLHQRHPGLDDITPVEVQATLLEFTARSISRAAMGHQPDTIYICGGGAHNGQLMMRLTELCKPCPVTSSAEVGLDPDWIEATLFAWLAWRRVMDIPSDIHTITGSQQARVLGAWWSA